MPINKNKYNAFYYFMLDWKKQEEKEGRLFVNGLEDLRNDPALNEAWKKLSDNERLVYKGKEKNGKLKQNANKKTNLGESLEEVLQVQIREKLFNDRMKEQLSSIVEEAKANNSVHKLKFYAIHVNYYCIYDSEIRFKYCPAEIGLVEFSLEKGVMRSYSKITNSEIRKGYAYETKEHSKNTHQIPKEPVFGEKNYYQIFKEICEFVNPEKVDGKIPPLFTLFSVENVKNSVISVLDFLASFSKQDTTNFVVYSFEELFVSLHNINLEENSYNAKVDEIIVSIYLKKDPFDYKTSLCCEYHKIGPGGNFCSTSIVQRWIFILFSYVCSLLQIKLIPGYHEPIEDSSPYKERELNKSFAALNVFQDACAAQTSAAAWSTGIPVKSASERTFRDEEIRRALSKPLSFTFHGSFESEPTDSLIFSKKQPVLSSTESPRSDESTGIDMSENNFPSIGRGSAIRRYIQKNKTSEIVSSHANQLKK